MLTQPLPVRATLAGVDQYTKLLLPFRGNDGGSVFEDASPGKLTATLNGTPTTSKTQYKFHGTSGLFGSGKWLTYSSSDLNMGTGDFTLESWLYPVGDGTNFLIIMAQSANGFSFNRVKTTHLLQFAQANVGVICTSAGAIADNTWTHVAVTRAGTAVKLFINGSVDGTATSSANLNQSATGIAGYSGVTAGDCWNGYLAQTRISKGVARWTANFKPPVLPYN